MPISNNSTQKKSKGTQSEQSDCLNFKDFVNSVYSIFGTYLRLMNVDEIESELRLVFKAL